MQNMLKENHHDLYFISMFVTGQVSLFSTQLETLVLLSCSQGRFLFLSFRNLALAQFLSTFSDLESISTSAIFAHFCQKLGSSREMSVLFPDEMKLAWRKKKYSLK